MPPCPNSSRNSYCGRRRFNSAGNGGTKRAAAPDGGGVVAAGCGSPIGPLSNPAANRHFGQSPPGASAGSSQPHAEQVFASLIAAGPVWLPSLVAGEGPGV